MFWYQAFPKLDKLLNGMFTFVPLQILSSLYLHFAFMYLYQVSMSTAQYTHCFFALLLMFFHQVFTQTAPSTKWLHLPLYFCRVYQVDIYDWADVNQTSVRPAYYIQWQLPIYCKFLVFPALFCINKINVQGYNF